MIIILIEESEGDIIVVRLPHANMLLDPRIMGLDVDWDHYSFSVHGKDPHNHQN